MHKVYKILLCTIINLAKIGVIKHRLLTLPIAIISLLISSSLFVFDKLYYNLNLLKGDIKIMIVLYFLVYLILYSYLGKLHHYSLHNKDINEIKKTINCSKQNYINNLIAFTIIVFVIIINIRILLGCKNTIKKTYEKEIKYQIDLDKQVVVANCRCCHTPGQVGPEGFGPPENKMLKLFKSINEFEIFIKNEFSNDSIRFKIYNEHKNANLKQSEIESVIRFIRER